MNERTRLVEMDKRVCTNCGRRVPEWSRQVHTVLCWRGTGRVFEEVSGTNIVTCIFCERDFGASDVDQHLYLCSAKTSLCRRCERFVLRRDMTEHSDSKCEYGATRESDLDAESGFLYINEGGRCVYCRSHVTEELIESHLHNCPGRLEICNLCFSLVHLREMNSHDQSNCERYIAGRAFRMKEVRLLPLGLNLSSLKRLAPWIAVTFVIVFIACFSTYEAIQYMSTPVPENFHP